VRWFAYDWIGENWYLVDSVGEVIMLCRGDLTICVPIVEHHLSQPRSVVLDPLEGKMFFSIWGLASASLDVADMDGSNRYLYFLATPKISNNNNFVFDEAAKLGLAVLSYT